MAEKKYIVKQTVNYAGRGDKTSTFIVPCGSVAELEIITGYLDGAFEVYEMNSALSNPDALTASSSVVVADSIKCRLKGAETVFISAYKRPIVFKSTTNLNDMAQQLKAVIKPFAGSYSAEKATDVSIDTGNPNTL